MYSLEGGSRFELDVDERLQGTSGLHASLQGTSVEGPRSHLRLTCCGHAQVLMMQAGFALMESSYVRQKNSANIVMKNGQASYFE